jgi:REP element-mobilizing transposase RayT
MKDALKFPPVVFNGHQSLAIAKGFQRMAEKSSYRIHACSILPEHVHLVIGRYTYKVEQVVRLLKAEASIELAKAGLHPLARWRQPDGSVPSPWAKFCWKVFLDDIEGIVRAVRYVEQNPVKEGKRQQKWPFIIPFVQPRCLLILRKKKPVVQLSWISGHAYSWS